MSLVRVKDSSKRQREPKALSVDGFRRVLENIPEPFRTMCIVAMCLRLRVSEILGLRWNDIDWEGLRLEVRQAYVYGKQGDVKTKASHRWMPLDCSPFHDAEPYRLYLGDFCQRAIQRDAACRVIWVVKYGHCHTFVEGPRSIIAPPKRKSSTGEFGAVLDGLRVSPVILGRDITTGQLSIR
jgi:site-specific recombinase XerC